MHAKSGSTLFYDLIVYKCKSNLFLKLICICRWIFYCLYSPYKGRAGYNIKRINGNKKASRAYNSVGPKIYQYDIKMRKKNLFTFQSLSLRIGSRFLEEWSSMRYIYSVYIFCYLGFGIDKKTYITSHFLANYYKN